MVHIPGATKEKEVWYFYSTTCPWCQKQAPILDEFLAEHPEISAVKINVEEDPDAAAMNNINSFPVIIPLINGSFRERITGYAEKDRLEQMILGA